MRVFQDMGFFQPMGQHKVFIGKNSRGGPISDDLAFIQDYGPLVPLRHKFQIVGRYDLCRREGLR
jgi:hypothetical protein